MPPADRASLTRALLREIEATDHHIVGGIVGTKYILPALAENGHMDVAMQLLQQDTQPSWGFWVKHAGATTLWENFKATNLTDAVGSSRNHIMFGAVAKRMLVARFSLTATRLAALITHNLSTVSPVSLSALHSPFCRHTGRVLLLTCRRPAAHGASVARVPSGTAGVCHGPTSWRKRERADGGWTCGDVLADEKERHGSEQHGGEHHCRRAARC